MKNMKSSRRRHKRSVEMNKIMILDKIAADTKIRVNKEKRNISFSQMRAMAYEKEKGTGFLFEKMLKEPGMHYICEVKKASPSKGVIAEEFPYLEIAKEYEAAGAGAISCLTEPKYFLGKNKYLQEIADTVRIPVLRKDFTVDEYMIYEAKVLGASAVLLICAILDMDTIRRYIKICDQLGLSALVEVHDEEEMKSAVQAGARVIGVNNRNLKDFTVDIGNSLRLREKAPEETLFVAESGIKTAEDVRRLKEAQVKGVLIGETLMRSPDKKECLRQLDS